MAKQRNDTLQDILRLSRALSDESRVRILMALRIGELCLCQLIDLLCLAPSTVSRHASVLKDAGFIEGRKEARWHYYRLAGDKASPAVRKTLRWLMEVLAGDASLEEDLDRLKSILQKDKEELCARYRS